ncbi:MULTISPECIES: 50S ribosomal protein L18 [Sphingobium]|jgi:large subunit ribosomal protein L18|uniref:Large ribosomal subunit protein uL18 n=1 Tax=Sphingobium xenophagum TaxID=121428 RepID=A0ABU1X448_SPHXE|nr:MULTISPECIES: 50S ribosomal protein L18 [Sphingobium]MDE0947744.1 50S ribosomal protein L18 [Sphingobium sp.]OHC44287.1 MAG: 50S ribosomal protein L18 [Rhodobacteraceae bacterium GWE1_64_9]OHC97425.1 MAG: 50S ribosomal protein L18 [Sphingomonadales bacterium RIFCSPLOWO2_12_FULL_63_15]OHD02876.1 MAG: 50S ribosomal protein L18 [Sphingomonadales bacterium GWF1_63_6]AOF98438.1 ribosomal protein L18 [Sphingobium sp. RAC03]|tara:strand:- start:15481 stop:15834 length:354 start_codon:yes stop_codon:yes gene_type:complete
MAKLSLFARRRRRVRTALKAVSGTRPRLSIHRSGRHIYAQIIDDAAGTTVAAASTLDKDVRGKTGATSQAAADVGKRVAAAATAAGVTRVVFDRGGFLFHGRVKALADAAREGGLEF